LGIHCDAVERGRKRALKAREQSSKKEKVFNAWNQSKPKGNFVKRWQFVLIIIEILSVAVIGTFAYIVLQPGRHYESVLMYQWNASPIANASSPFTITGKQWYVKCSAAGYGQPVAYSLNMSVLETSTNKFVDQATLTNQQTTHYFTEQGTFYLNLKVNNPTNLTGQLLFLIDVWQLS
jgi:nitrate reductase NapE component